VCEHNVLAAEVASIAFCSFCSSPQSLDQLNDGKQSTPKQYAAEVKSKTAAANTIQRFYRRREQRLQACTFFAASAGVSVSAAAYMKWALLRGAVIKPWLPFLGVGGGLAISGVATVGSAVYFGYVCGMSYHERVELNKAKAELAAAKQKDAYTAAPPRENQNTLRFNNANRKPKDVKRLLANLVAPLKPTVSSVGSHGVRRTGGAHAPRDGDGSLQRGASGTQPQLILQI
jgi:hypothetical protein